MATWNLVSIDTVDEDGKAYVTIDVVIPYPVGDDTDSTMQFRQQLLGIQTKTDGSEIAETGIAVLDGYTTDYEEQWLAGQPGPGDEAAPPDPN